VTAVVYRLVAMIASTIKQNALAGYVRRNASGALVSTTPAIASDGTADRCAAVASGGRGVPGDAAKKCVAPKAFCCISMRLCLPMGPRRGSTITAVGR
jgi:hypothetical protein